MDGIEYPSLTFSILQGSEGDFVEGEGAFSGRAGKQFTRRILVCLKKEGFIYPPKVQHDSPKTLAESEILVGGTIISFRFYGSMLNFRSLRTFKDSPS